MLGEWHIAATKMKLANEHYLSNLKRFYMLQFQQAIILAQISSQKKLRAQKFRENNMKYEFLWFLKEYHYEQQTKKSNHTA